jgi:hypothetical protein
VADIEERLRAFHREIVESDGAESEQMAMEREAADTIAELRGKLAAAEQRCAEMADALAVAHRWLRRARPDEYRSGDVEQYLADKKKVEAALAAREPPR